MNETSVVAASMAIDLKKNRIRIHKATIHHLGDPKYIQLLIHPQSMAVAIRCLDKPHSGEPHHKVSQRKMASDNSYEIYSSSLMVKLSETIPNLDCGFSYRMSGKLDTEKRIAVFDLRTLQPIES